MSGITPLSSANLSTPSLEPQVQVEGTINPGLNANQISLATPPASFSQGKRFFITENNGSYQLSTISSSGSSSQGANVNPEISADALEVNASIAYAITTGQISAGSHMAEQVARNFRLSDVTRHVGASALQTPSLAGEISGDRVDASRILQFLKQNKAERDDSDVSAEVSARGQNLSTLSLLANLNTYLTNKASADALQANIATMQAQAKPDQAAIATATAQLQTLRASAASAFSSAQADAQALGNQIFSSGLKSLNRDIDKLNKDQLAKLTQLLANTVTQSLSEQIDQILLGNTPIASPTNASTVQTRDGTVIKTVQAQTKEALLAQLQTEDFREQIALAIRGNAAALGLGNLSANELNSIGYELAKLTAQEIIRNPQVIDKAISNSDTLMADIGTILELELEGQTTRSALHDNV